MNSQRAQKHLNRIWFHWIQLQKALNHAHTADLIAYEEYAGEAPCETMIELKRRIEATTNKQLAEIIQQEIRTKIWNR